MCGLNYPTTSPARLWLNRSRPPPPTAPRPSLTSLGTKHFALNPLWLKVRVVKVRRRRVSKGRGLKICSISPDYFNINLRTPRLRVAPREHTARHTKQRAEGQRRLAGQSDLTDAGNPRPNKPHRRGVYLRGSTPIMCRESEKSVWGGVRTTAVHQPSHIPRTLAELTQC